MKSEEIVNKYLKPHSAVNKLPEEEYKHLADLFNQAQDWKEPQLEEDSFSGTGAVSQELLVTKEQENNLYNDYPDSWITANSKNQVFKSASTLCFKSI